MIGLGGAGAGIGNCLGESGGETGLGGGIGNCLGESGGETGGGIVRGMGC